jgi:hypothetical protein
MAVAGGMLNALLEAGNALESRVTSPSLQVLIDVFSAACTQPDETERLLCVHSFFHNL